MEVKEFFTKAWAYVLTVAKASVAGIVAAFTFFLAVGVIQTDLNPVAAFFDAVGQIGSFTLAQWFSLIIAVLAAYGITWAVPNKS